MNQIITTMEEIMLETCDGFARRDNFQFKDLWDGKTTNMGYHDLLGLDVIEKCRKEAERPCE